MFEAESYGLDFSEDGSQIKLIKNNSTTVNLSPLLQGQRVELIDDGGFGDPTRLNVC